MTSSHKILWNYSESDEIFGRLSISIYLGAVLLCSFFFSSVSFGLFFTA